MIPNAKFNVNAKSELDAEDCCKSSCWSMCCSVFSKSRSVSRLSGRDIKDDNYYKYKYKKIEKVILENLTPEMKGKPLETKGDAEEKT